MATITPRPGVPDYREKPLRIAAVQFDPKVRPRPWSQIRFLSPSCSQMMDLLLWKDSGSSAQYRTYRGHAERVRLSLLGLRKKGVPDTLAYSLVPGGCSLQPGSADLIVLPEMALTGYMFESLADIEPLLEVSRTLARADPCTQADQISQPARIGPTSLFCRALAQRTGSACLSSERYQLD